MAAPEEAKIESGTTPERPLQLDLEVGPGSRNLQEGLSTRGAPKGVPGGARKARPEERLTGVARKAKPEERMPESKEGSQILAGTEDVLDIALDPLRKTFGTIVFNPETASIEYLNPESAMQAKEEGRLGIPFASKRPPEGVIEESARFAGQSATGAPFFGAAAKLKKAEKALEEGASRFDKATRFVKQSVHEIGENFRTRPFQFTVGEGVAGLGAGAGGAFAAEVFEGSDSARFVGQIIGGTAPSLMPTSIGVKASGWLAKKVDTLTEPFTPIGGLERARQRVDRAITPEGRARIASKLAEPTTIDNATGKAVLTDAQRLEEPGLLELEKSIFNNSSDLRQLGDRQVANANVIIQQSFREIGTSPTSVAVDFIEESHKYLDHLIDTRIRVAALRVEKRIADLGPNVTQLQTNLIVAEELQAALKAARKQEDILYKAIDPETKTPFIKSLTKFQEIKKDTSLAQQEDIAAVAEVLTKLLPKKKPIAKAKITGDVQDAVKVKPLLKFNVKKATPEEMVQRLADEMQVAEIKFSEADKVAETAVTIQDELLARGFSGEDAGETVAEMLKTAQRQNEIRLLKGLPDELAEAPDFELLRSQPFTTVKELRGVQSKLREVSRQATADKKFNKARIAREIADEITEDLSDITEIPDAMDELQIAITFSRNLNKRFNSGTVGKLLRKDDQGGLRIPEALTLERSIGVGGPEAQVAMVDIVKALNSPESAGSRVVIEAAEDYMMSRFLAKAVYKGKLNMTSVESFIKSHKPMLNALPNLRGQIDEAIEMQSALILTERQRARVQLKPKQSKAAMFVLKSPSEAFHQISKLRPEAAGREMQLLINRVAKDKTGEATEGLKSSFIEYLVNTSKAGELTDVDGLQILSGFKLRDALVSPSINKMAVKLFTKEEKARLQMIVNDLVRLEKAVKAKGAAEGVLGDHPSKMMEAVAGIMGASAGRRLGRALGSGGTVQIPGIIAARFRDLTRAGIHDPGSKLLIDAALDENLYKELLVEPMSKKTGELSAVAIRRLNIWAYNAIAEYGGVYKEDEEE